MLKKGSIVLVPFPFTDLSGKKVRPALIISSGKINNDVVVVFITSQNKLRIKHLVSLSPNETNGLKVKSRIVCSKIATLETKTILGELGLLTKEQQAKVDAELREVLNL